MKKDFIFGHRPVNVTMNAEAWHDSRGVLLDAEKMARNLVDILEQIKQRKKQE